jgi:hypothetical protein
MVQVYPVFIYLDFLQDAGGTLVIVPKSGGQGKLLVVVYFGRSVLDVKETSSGQEHGPSYL